MVSYLSQKNQKPKKPKKIVKNINFSEEIIKKCKELGIKNFSDFVRYSVNNEIRNIELESLKEKYKEEEEVENDE